MTLEHLATRLGCEPTVDAIADAIVREEERHPYRWLPWTDANLHGVAEPLRSQIEIAVAVKSDHLCAWFTPGDLP